MIKSFEVDFDSIDSCLQTIGVLKSRLGTLRAETEGSKRSRQAIQLSACQAILSTDITSVYDGIQLDAAMCYNVYAHLDPSHKIAIGKSWKTTFAATLGMSYFPFYIGKGVDGRAENINRNETHRKIKQRLATFNLQPHVHLIASGLTEVDAFSLEAKLIDIFGLITNKGLLTNLDEGHNRDQRRALYSTHLKLISNLYQNSA